MTPRILLNENPTAPANRRWAAHYENDGRFVHGATPELAAAALQAATSTARPSLDDGASNALVAGRSTDAVRVNLTGG